MWLSLIMRAVPSTSTSNWVTLLVVREILLRLPPNSCSRILRKTPECPTTATEPEGFSLLIDSHTATTRRLNCQTGSPVRVLMVVRMTV